MTPSWSRFEKFMAPELKRITMYNRVSSYTSLHRGSDLYSVWLYSVSILSALSHYTLCNSSFLVKKTEKFYFFFFFLPKRRTKLRFLFSIFVKKLELFIKVSKHELDK